MKSVNKMKFLMKLQYSEMRGKPSNATSVSVSIAPQSPTSTAQLRVALIQNCVASETVSPDISFLACTQFSISDLKHHLVG